MPNYYDQTMPLDPNTMQTYQAGLGQMDLQQQPNYRWQTKAADAARGLLGNRDLALALLANSGASPQPRGFGEILGSSMMQADQMKSQRADDAFKRQYMMAQMNAMQSRSPQAESPYGKVQPGDFTTDSLAKFDKSKDFNDLVRIQPLTKVPVSQLKPAAAPATPTGFNDPRIQALQASFVAAGYAPPAGFRSKDQQLAMYQGLLKKYEGLSTDDIAHLAASNAVDYKSVGKATQAAATMGGRVEVANNELRGFIPIAKDASAAVDRGAFVPFNRLKQKGQASISDPNLKRMFVATQTVLNAYDVLAARGGTDKDKRAENHKILENADSPEAYNAALDMIMKEAEAAGVATQNAMKAGAFGYSTGQPAPKETAAERAKRMGL